MKLMEGILCLAKELGSYNISNEESVITFEQGNDMGNAVIKRVIKTWLHWCLNRLESEGTRDRE